MSSVSPPPQAQERGGIRSRAAAAVISNQPPAQPPLRPAPLLLAPPLQHLEGQPGPPLPFTVFVVIVDPFLTHGGVDPFLTHGAGQHHVLPGGHLLLSPVRLRVLIGAGDGEHAAYTGVPWAPS